MGLKYNKLNKKEFSLLIDEICDLEPGTTSFDDSVNDVAIFDSLSLLGLIATLDKKFGINFSMEELNGIGTIGDLFNKINEISQHQENA